MGVPSIQPNLSRFTLMAALPLVLLHSAAKDHHAPSAECGWTVITAVVPATSQNRKDVPFSFTVPEFVESEQRVYRSCSRYAGVHVDIFQAEIAAKLLKQTSPLKAPARVQASAPTLSLKFCRDLQVPLCQAVCVRIIYALVIFIGPPRI